MTKCKHRWHVFAVAVGRFHPAGPRGYRAAPVPDAPVRATRAEAEADHCDALHGTDLWAPKSPRDGGDASEADQTPQREAVRDLHAPDALSGSLRCLGCDFEGWEAELPDWPCRTARLVYSDDEIADTLATYASWSAWVGAAQRRAYLASGWTFADDVVATVNRALVALATGDTALARAIRAQYDEGIL